MTCVCLQWWYLYACLRMRVTGQAQIGLQASQTGMSICKSARGRLKIFVYYTRVVNAPLCLKCRNYYTRVVIDENTRPTGTFKNSWVQKRHAYCPIGRTQSAHSRVTCSRRESHMTPSLHWLTVVSHLHWVHAILAFTTRV